MMNNNNEFGDDYNYENLNLEFLSLDRNDRNKNRDNNNTKNNTDNKSNNNNDKNDKNNLKY